MKVYPYPTSGNGFLYFHVPCSTLLSLWILELVLARTICGSLVVPAESLVRVMTPFTDFLFQSSGYNNKIIGLWQCCRGFPRNILPLRHGLRKRIIARLKHQILDFLRIVLCLHLIFLATSSVEANLKHICQ